MELPKSVRFVVIGAGVHGLSTAYHLAKELKARGEGSGEDILIVDKTGIAAGASGIACGVVRNNYYQPAMSELMAANVEVWESDPAAYHYNSVGYMALGPKGQESDLTEVAGRQERIGYEHTLVTGEAECASYMRDLFPDWRAQGITVVLHEHRGGFAFNVDSMHGIADKAKRRGRADRRRRRRDGLRQRRLRRGHEGADRPGRDRGRAGDRRRRPVGAADLVDARPARGDRHPHAVGRRPPQPGHVDVLVPAGGRDRGRPEDVRPPRRLRAAGDPRRHRRAAARRQRQADHRRAVGHLLQARPATACRAVPRR